MKQRYRTTILALVLSITVGSPAPAYADARTAPCYPSEIRIGQNVDGTQQLEKRYILSRSDDPQNIPREDFSRENKKYVFVDLLKSDETKTETAMHTELYTSETGTSDMAQILKQLPASIPIQREDGFSGDVALDHTSITVEVKGYATKSDTTKTVRTFPNLSDADISLVPKSVQEGTKTLGLANVSWEPAAQISVDGYAVAQRYTAVATYTGTGTSKTATGYVVAAEYVGELSRLINDTIIYTAIYSIQPQYSVWIIGLLTSFAAVLLLFWAMMYMIRSYKKTKNERLNAWEDTASED